MGILTELSETLKVGRRRHQAETDLAMLRDISYQGAVRYPQIGICERIIKGVRVPEFAGVTELPLPLQKLASLWPAKIGQYGYLDFQQRDTTRLYIVRLWVPDDFRNQGHGASLVKGIETVARGRECEILCGDVEKGNDALNFWKHLGYTISQEYPNTFMIEKALTA